MSAHRQRLADHLDFPAPAAPGPDTWRVDPADVAEPDLARRLAPDLLMPDEEPAAVRDRTRQLGVVAEAVGRLRDVVDGAGSWEKSG